MTSTQSNLKIALDNGKKEDSTFLLKKQQLVKSV